MTRDSKMNRSVVPPGQGRGSVWWTAGASRGRSAAVASVRALLLMAVAVGCAEESVAPVGLLGPGDFRIVASTAPERSERRDPETGTLERRGLSFEEHIAVAWGADPRDLEFRLEGPVGRYDVSARSTDGTLEVAEAVFRGGLVEHFGLRVRRDVRDTDVIALQVVRRGYRPQPVDADAEYAPAVLGRASYRARGVPISEFVIWLRSHANRPIVDETRLTGRYDITLEWDPATGPRAFEAALRDAGFLLIHARKRYAFLVIEANS